MPLRLFAALFAALLPLATMLLSLAPQPARAAEFTDAAGRRLLLPERIRRVMPADRNAEVLLLVLAPDRLAGLESVSQRAEMLPRSRRVPLLQWGLREGPQQMAATARRLHPDLIVDGGVVTPERAAFADQVQRLTGIPYMLVDDSFARIPRLLRSIGAVLGVDGRAADLAVFAEHALAELRGRLLIRPADARPHVYFALGAHGQETALPGSPAGAAIDEAGAINVAGTLGRGVRTAVRPEQLLAWNPDIIIAEHRGFYHALLHHRAWRRLAAVRGKRVYLEPTSPFGWIEDPSGVNRLIGLHWLSTLLYPDVIQEDLRATTCDFYDKFYQIKLKNNQIEAMLRPAGVPAPATSGPIEPLVGLGAAPPSTLPPGTPGGLTALPQMPTPETTATAVCAVSTGLSPQPLLGAAALPGLSPIEPPPPAGTPGLPPPGRRGRAVPGR